MRHLLLSAALLSVASIAQSETKGTISCDYYEIQNLQVIKRTKMNCSTGLGLRDATRPAAIPVKHVPGDAQTPKPDAPLNPEVDLDPATQPLPEPIIEPRASRLS